MRDIRKEIMENTFDVQEKANDKEEGFPIIKKDNKKESVSKKKDVSIVSNTSADVNWVPIVNKITIPNIVKGGLTIGGGSVGAWVGAGIATGIGFVAGGPTGAALGYKIGNYVGLGVGILGGNKFGKVVARNIEDEEREDIVKSGTTQINIEAKTKIETERNKKQDEYMGEI